MNPVNSSANYRSAVTFSRLLFGGIFICRFWDINQFLANVLILYPPKTPENETPTQVFSCEYCKMVKNGLFYRTPLVIQIIPLSLVWV